MPPAISREGVLPPDLAEGQPNVGEFLLEGFVHVLLEVGGFDVFDDRSLEKDVKIGGLFQKNGSLQPPPSKCS